MYYPENYHPVFFLRDALKDCGATVEYNNRDARTEGCYGLIINGRPFVWLIDNRWMHERATEDPAAARLLARGVLVCCAQKPDAQRIGAKWLPLASSPGFRTPSGERQKLYDLGFVGYIRDNERLEILRYCSRYFTLMRAEGLFGEDAVRVYWDSRAGLNVPMRYGTPLAYDSANMRCFEVLATGTPLITAYEPYLAELGLEHGLNCFLYDNPRAVGDCVRDVLAEPERAAEVGGAGGKLAFQHHRYEQRAQQVLAWLKLL